MVEYAGIIVGRFQPWHIGHRELYDEVREDYDKILIIIYSPPNSLSNPFFEDEVYRMIKKDVCSKDGSEIKTIKSTKNPLDLKKRIYQAIKELCDGDKAQIVTKDNSVFYGLRLLGFDVVKKNGETPIRASKIREMIYKGNDAYKKFVNEETVNIVEDVFPQRYYELLKNGKRPKRDLLIM